MVVSSTPPRVRSDGTIDGPARGEVIVVLVEDRLLVDRPVGDLRRPARFSVTWSRLTQTIPAHFCGDPAAPAFLRYFRTRGRYLGFIVYPGAQPPRQVRETTLAVMDSLRVAR